MGRGAFLHSFVDFVTEIPDRTRKTALLAVVRRATKHATWGNAKQTIARASEPVTKSTKLCRNGRVWRMCDHRRGGGAVGRRARDPLPGESVGQGIAGKVSAWLAIARRRGDERVAFRWRMRDRRRGGGLPADKHAAGRPSAGATSRQQGAHQQARRACGGSPAGLPMGGRADCRVSGERAVAGRAATRPGCRWARRERGARRRSGGSAWRPGAPPPGSRGTPGPFPPRTRRSSCTRGSRRPSSC